MNIDDVDAALAFLAQLDAPARLIRHHQLVAEAAREIVDGLDGFAHHFDAKRVLVGAALHDAGKIAHPNEMTGPGHRHELRGERILRDHGLEDLSRFCVTHARWHDEGLTLDDLLVALADKLWKGKRVTELERLIVQRLAAASDSDFWDVFVTVDDLFERVAARGDDRLGRSVEYASTD